MEKTKYCARCGEVKNVICFQKNKTRKSGLQSTCSECFKRLYRKLDRLGSRKRHLLRYYGLKWDDYLLMFEEQNGKCAICKIDLKLIGDKNIKSGMHVDHSHESNSIRGLLCHDCNAGLGYFKENITILNNAIDYLEFFKHKDK